MSSQDEAEEFCKIESDTETVIETITTQEEEVQEQDVQEQDVQEQDVQEQDVQEQEVQEEDEQEEEVDDDDDDINYFDNDENTIYSISINDVPYFYEDKFAAAVRTMNLTARTLIYKSNSELEHSIVFRDDYNIDVYKNFLFFRFHSYTLRINVVRRFNKELVYEA